MALTTGPILEGRISYIGIEIYAAEIEGWYWRLWNIIRGQPKRAFAEHVGGPIATRKDGLRIALRVARAYLADSHPDGTAVFRQEKRPRF